MSPRFGLHHVSCDVNAHQSILNMMNQTLMICSSCACVCVGISPGFRQQDRVLVWRSGFWEVVKDG